MYTPHTICRACGYGRNPNAPGTKSSPHNERLVKVFDLGIQPLANDFCHKDQECAGFAPLAVLHCPRCSLAQLSVSVRPDILYSHYCYQTSRSDVLKEHIQSLFRFFDSLNPQWNSVVEIGSNDGEFLSKCSIERGCKSLYGIDPSVNQVDVSRSRGINAICDTFNCNSASMARCSVPNPDFIVARHVFCHADDWQEWMKALDQLAGERTIIFIEVPHVLRTIQNLEWDQIYHEHKSFLSIGGLLSLLDNTPFELFSLREFQIHGGAVGLCLRRRTISNPLVLDYSSLLAEESKACTAVGWKEFESKSQELRNELQSLLFSLSLKGKSVYGFGASAKCTVWCNALGANTKVLQQVVDCTPDKQYTLVPGTDIPVVDEGALLRDRPDYAVLFAWNFKDEILRRYRNLGVKFIVPIPKVEIL